MARPAEFDRDEVIRKATAAFCRTGYTATSISELVKVTKLKPGSLYGAFNSKRGLFLEVLSVYADKRKKLIETRLTSKTSPIAALQHYLDLLVEEIDITSEHPQTDLVLKTMVELGAEDEEIREFSKQHLAGIEALICKVLVAAQACGELSQEARPKMMAKFIVTNIIGMRVTGNAQPKKEDFQQLIAQMLTVLAIPTPSVSIPAAHTVSA